MLSQEIPYKNAHFPLLTCGHMQKKVSEPFLFQENQQKATSPETFPSLFIGICRKGLKDAWQVSSKHILQQKWW